MSMRYFFSPDKSLRSGFTLIELMVAISVIGILVAIVYTNFSQARMQARDNVRINQLEQLRVALELYKDEYGRYPAAGCGATTGQWAGAALESAATWDVGDCPLYIAGSSTAPFVPEFMEELPIDPRGTTTAQRGFFYRSNGTSYKILVLNSVESLVVGETDTGHPYKRYASGCVEAADGTTYAIYSAGAQCW
jgi:prepilin-type N-terminal cleavage/methylation domain-containing protein